MPEVRNDPLRIRTKRTWLINTLIAFVWIYTMRNIFVTSWAGDDWPVSQTRGWILWRLNEVSPRIVLHEALYWNNEWMVGQGRFYPMAWIESRFAMTYFSSLLSYKILSVIIFSMLIYLILRLLRRFGLSQEWRIGFFLVFICSMQFRRSFDPHFAFLLMVPSMLIKMILSCLFLHRSFKENGIKRSYWILLSCLFFFAAMATYEFAFLLFPILLCTAGIAFIQTSQTNVEQTRNKIVKSFLPAVLSIFFTWICYGVIVFGYLRIRAVAISGSYELGISWESLSVFFQQLLAPIPLNTVILDFFVRKSKFGNIGPMEIVFFILVFALCSKTLRAHDAARAIAKKDKKKPIQKNVDIYLGSILCAFSATLIVTPAFMLALQKTWWGTSSFTNTYLGVLIQEIGISILIVSLWYLFQSQYYSRRKNRRVV